MKRLISLSLFLSSALCSHAQDVNKTLTLDEVTVQAAKVVNKVDGLLIYPTNAQKQGSNNGFSILEKLSFANLRIDHVNHAVTAIDNRGEVQLRVNGVVVGKQEMLALDPKDVVKIDFINNPGVRYGEGIAYVVDIVTRRSESGYTVGTDLTASLTTLQGDGMVYGKWNRGKSEWSLSYGMSGYRSRGGKSMQLARYTLADGSLYTIERNDVETLRKTMGQDAKVIYNWADSTATVFQASLAGSLSNAPDNYRIKDIVDITHGLQLSYTYQQQDRVSRIAMTSDAMVRTNNMEWTVGNPDLKPSRDREHRLQLSYNTNRLQTFIDAYFKQCIKPNMAHYHRTDDNRFIYTQINQKEIDALHMMAYAGYWLVPEKLQVAANGGLFRCFNYGQDYTHLYTSWFYVGSITAYLGPFTLQGYIDNGNRFFEGESKGYNDSYSVLTASYTWRDWQFSVSWANLFDSHYKAYENELLNRDLYKHTIGYSNGNGNQVSINISWRLSRGSKHKAAEKRINLRDTDNGIIK